MQLNQGTPIRQALGAATCALLGVSPVAVADPGDWTVDAAALFYQESDRVTALEPVINLRREFDEERFLDMKLAVDTLTGASPSGAVPSDRIETYTRPSGRKQYEVRPGTLPLDESFRDTRVALSSAWQQPLGRQYRINGGASASVEYDYRSLAVNGGLSRDFNRRNTTLSAGLSLAHDQIEPEGGIPVPLSTMVVDTGQSDFKEAFKATRGDTSDTKTTIDVLLGVTQVVNRRTLMQFNYSLSQAEGYLADPFKIVSLVDTSTGYATSQIYENRPDSRVRHALYWQTKHHFDRDILDLSYRFMSDDWQVNSHTLDLRYRWMFSPGKYLEPRVCYDTQEAARFYSRYLPAGEAVPRYATADYRLGDLDSVTLGLKYGWPAGGMDISLRAEYLRQTSQVRQKAVGALQGLDLQPDLDAFMLTFGVRF